MEVIIQGGRVIDPSQGVDRIADVYIADGRIREIRPGRDGAHGAGRGPGAASEGLEVIDATGKIVCPGLIDMHVHLREPGNEDAENIASGCAAAVAGGFTSIACMPNTEPAIDNEAMVDFIYRQAARAGLCNVYPIGAITKGRRGKELAEIGQMVRAGAVAFSDDGEGVANSSVMFRAMQYVTMFDRPIIQHCEDADLAAKGCMNGGVTATRLGLPGIPAIAEEVMLQRDLLIARHTGARYHAAHVSTAGAVEMIREARSRAQKVTAEVCPHHLLLTEERVATYDTNYKMNPPLRTRADVDECVRGVADGTLDCLVTDHAPHGPEEKQAEFQNAPFGVIGLEVALPLFIEALLAPGHLDWPGLISRLTVNPARILGLKKGTLRPGADADVTIFDPEKRWVIDAGLFRSRSRNCAFIDREVTGRVSHTLVGGRVKHCQEAAATAV